MRSNADGRKPGRASCAGRALRAYSWAMSDKRLAAQRVALGLVLSLGAPSVRAEPAPTASDATASDATARARADTLFREGRQLIAEGKLELACTRFEQSQSLDPSPGTLLNLGACHEKRGDLVRAQQDFERASALALKHPDPTRRRAWTAAAEKELGALTPRIPKLRLKLPATPSLGVWLDGAELAQPLPEAGTLVNPGAHAIEARAPSRATWHASLSVAEGEVSSVVIPELVPLLAPEPAAPAGHDGGAAASRVPAFVAFGASGALLGAGVVTGVLAKSAQADLDERCTAPDPARPGGVLCDPSLRSTRDRARTLSIVTDVLWVGAVASAGLGAYFWLSAPAHDDRGAEPASRDAAARVSAGCDGTGCALAVAGAF